MFIAKDERCPRVVACYFSLARRLLLPHCLLVCTVADLFGLAIEKALFILAEYLAYDGPNSRREEDM